MSHPSTTALRLSSLEVRTGAGLPLPSLLCTATRSGPSSSAGAALDPLLAGVVVEKVYALGAASRSGTPGRIETLDTSQPQLLALETEEGSTLFIRSDTLAETVARLQPEAVIDGEVDFARFVAPGARTRGFGEVVWKAVSVLRLPTDGLLDEARELAREWCKEQLKGQLGDLAATKAAEWGSALGAKALMWTIESRLVGRPGLYRWHDARLAADDRCPIGESNDPRLSEAAQGKPMLVLIHGTGSYTVGAFADLRDDEATWSRLRQRFPGGIFGFEHRTFSESPSENALALLHALPLGANVSLLTHSRGGLVGDLICLGQVPDRVIDAYGSDAGNLHDALYTDEAYDPDGLERTQREERLRLREIRDTLAAGRINVQRYVRVACPARGTRFLSDNLDAALSDFLGLLQWGGGALVGATAAALGGPVAGETFGKGASSCLGVLKRLALEIAGRRIDPRLVPGIAAMRTDSPLAAFLADPDTHRRDGIAMAVIAGDTEFDGLGVANLRRRVASLFCDWRLFERNDNDLVVDTESMYAGLARQTGTRYLYDQDAAVTHFRYFRNPLTRDALRGWLTDDDPLKLDLFRPLAGGAALPWHDRAARLAQRDAASGPKPARPVAIVIPGIMGSHIEVDRKKPDRPGSGRRVWFELPSLLLGNLSRIADPEAPNVVAEDLFERFYGDLADHLAATHTVIRCPYDWRRPVEQCAEALKARIEQATRDHPGQPIRLLAHSMGGLVTRALIARHPESWQTVLRSGGRLLMLGTPNNGSHLMVHSLLGKSDSLRMLTRIDTEHGLQGVLDIVGGFPGALALLPRPGFADAGSEPRIDSAAFYAADTWRELKEQNTDRWFGDHLGATIAETLLKAGANFWNDTLAGNEIPDPERVCYVFGQGEKTPCGVAHGVDGRLKLLFTGDGDGSVTWASGRLDNLDADTHGWYMPVEHGDLTGAEEYFPAIVELLETGTTDKLGRLPRRRGETSANFVLEAPPPVLPTEDELARACLGSGPRRRKTSRAKSALRVAVRAGDLRFLDQPVLCGHYIGDAISGAEDSLDEMLDGALAERERLGVYAAEIGTSAIILRPPSGEEGARGSRHGAVIVGLGKFNGQLSARQITETVRAGVVRFLLQLRDALLVRTDTEVQLYSLLIGWNSTASISVTESVAAVTRGVLEANHQFNDALSESPQRGATVSELCFIELFRNAAISAAHAVLDLPDNLAGDLKRLGARIEPAATLTIGEGMTDRLNVDADLGHWSRLIVTDADADAEGKNQGNAGTAAEPATAAQANTPAVPYYPERLKYVFLSQRARAEAVVQQRQPGLIEAIIRDQRRNPAYDAKLGQTLFQLMVPLDYKSVAREQSRLLLVLDAYSANLPWELLQTEGEPLALKMPMIRQLTTPYFRATVRTANVNSACLIVAPSTYGFDKRFGGAQAQLDDLPAAVREGHAIADSLHRAGWNESDIVVSPAEREALDIFATLYARPYRILMIGAHGIFEARGLDGRSYSGVVLSDGLLLTAVEIGQMEVVPEVVFLSCCHLGSVNNPHSQPNRLAYSLSRKLIEMGVRCVVAAGWAVNDEAASTFASVFFARLTQGEVFGDAIFQARLAAFAQHPGSNTWGAYQAYGDPGYRLQTGGASGKRSKSHAYVAVDELLAALHGQRMRDRRRKADAQAPTAPTFVGQRQWVQRQLAQCPAAWAERPDVLQAIAEYYADFGSDGFAAAREAYQRAVQREDASGRVSVRAIEQLANMEARHGGKLADQGRFDAALPLIDSAVRRLQSLAEAVRGHHDDDGASDTNPERAAMLGSALKLKAATLMRMGRKWSVIAPCLEKAARAYRSGVTGAPALCPYNTLNALPLAWLAGTLGQPPDEAAAVARQCGEQARRAFASGKDFWNAVMSIDAELTAWLLGSPLEGAAGSQSVARVLGARYAQAVQSLPGSARQWDSVVKQWRLLAGFVALSGQDASGRIVRNLGELADHFDSRRAESTTTTTKRAKGSRAKPARPSARNG